MTFTVKELNEHRDKLWKELIPFCNGAPFLYMEVIEPINFLHHSETYWCKTRLGFAKIILN